jgi:DsbC/DsbD-like thiol-disulfide interchange protein
MFHLAILALTHALCFGPQKPPDHPNPKHTIPVSEPLQPKEHKGKASVEVRSDVGWVGSAQSFHIIVQITPDEGWHVYWKNPGASGAPTEIEINAPDGYVIGEPLFPRPKTFHGEEGQTYGYSSTAAIFIPVTAPETVHDGQIEFEVTTSWLSCKKSCVMGEQKHTLTLSTNFLHQGPPHKDMQLVHWLDALPKPLEDLAGGSSIVSGDILHVTGETSVRPIQFIGVERTGIRFDQPSQAIINGESFRLPIPIHIDFSSTEDPEIIVEGLLLFGRKSDDPSYVVQLAIDSRTGQLKGKEN